MKKLLALSVVMAGTLATQAGAVPLTKADGLAGKSTVTTVDMRRDRDRDRRDHDRRDWRRGDYERHGWHRHDRRPYNWRSRSCVAVGPVWFCP